MADPLSIAAGVAGLVGLSGQIFNGCLFIKLFLDDVKNAPADVIALQAELETLSAAAKSFDRLVSERSQNGESIIEKDFAPGLKQCLDVINGLQSYISADVTKFADGKRWRDRLTSAGKKSTIDKYLARLSRANATMQVTQNNLVASLQHSSQISIGELQKSVEACQLPLHEIKHNQLEISSSFRRLGESIEDELRMNNRQGSMAINLIDRNQSSMSSGFNEIGNTLQEIRDQIATEKASVAEMNADLIRAVVQTSIQSAMSLFQKDFPSSNNVSSSHPTLLRTPGQDIGRRPHRSRRNSTRLMYRRTYDFYLVRIFITSRGTFEDGSRSSPTSTNMTILVHLNLPRFRRGFSYTRNTIHEICAGGISQSLRSYNIIPEGHPMWEACNTFDFAKVHELFATGLASPFDRGPSGTNLLSTVIRCYALYHHRFGHTVPLEFAETCSKALSLISLLGKYLEFHDHIRECYAYLFLVFKCALRSELSDRYLADLLRLLLEQDYFPQSLYYDNGAFIHSGGMLTLAMRDTEVYSVLLQYRATESPLFKPQFGYESHPISRGSQEFRSNWTVIENSRQIIEDPEARLLQEGFTYRRPCIYYVLDTGFDDITLWTLLSLYLFSPPRHSKELRYACLKRLGILLFEQNVKKDLREKKSAAISPHIARKLGIEGLANACPDRRSSRRTEKSTRDEEPMIHLYLSTLEFAAAIDQLDLLHEALLLAEWNSGDIADLYDDEMYGGVPQLLGHEHDENALPFTYLTQKEGAAQFKDLLCSGQFIDYEHDAETSDTTGSDVDSRRKRDALEEVVNEWSATLQVHPWDVKSLIVNANLAWRQRRTPGSWVDGEILVPGRDFKCVCQDSWVGRWCVCDRSAW